MEKKKQRLLITEEIPEFIFLKFIIIVLSANSQGTDLSMYVHYIKYIQYFSNNIL